MRLMRFKLPSSLVGVIVAMGVAAGACGGTSVDAENSSRLSEGGSGCNIYIRGVLRRILPQTSDLSCKAIDDLIVGVPSEPGAYSILGGSPRLLWKCRLYGEQEAPRLILRCQHHKRHFSIVKRR